MECTSDILSVVDEYQQALAHSDWFLTEQYRLMYPEFIPVFNRLDSEQ